MNSAKSVDIDALIKAGKPVKDAIRRGGIEAMKQYIRAGESMVSWRDGHMVMLSPDELKAMLAQYEADMTEPFMTE